MSEADIKKDVRCQAMETLASGTLTGETLDFPTGFLQVKRLKIGDYLYDYRTPADYSEMSRKGSTEYVYTIIGQDIYILNGESGDDYELLYWKAFTAFSLASDTNWLLTNHPDVYLYAGCSKVAIVTKDDKALARWAALYQQAVRAANRVEWFAGRGTLQVRANGGNTP